MACACGNKRTDGAGRRHGCTQTAREGTEVRLHFCDGIYGAEDDRGVWLAWTADMRAANACTIMSVEPVKSVLIYG